MQIVSDYESLHMYLMYLFICMCLHIYIYDYAFPTVMHHFTRPYHCQKVEGLAHMPFRLWHLIENLYPFEQSQYPFERSLQPDQLLGSVMKTKLILER